MKAAVRKAINVVEVEEVAEPITRPDQIKVKVAYAGICGTDMEILEGRRSSRCRLQENPSAGPRALPMRLDVNGKEGVLCPLQRDRFRGDAHTTWAWL
jgi:threonine dehydrogenase-like Zn-dependent dehydrogenase